MSPMKPTARNTTSAWDQQKRQRSARKVISRQIYPEIASCPMRSRTVDLKLAETVLMNTTNEKKSDNFERKIDSFVLINVNSATGF